MISMTQTEKSNVITLRLSNRSLKKVDAVLALEKVDRSTLLKEFIEDGLQERVLDLYKKGKVSSGRGAEILCISLREFLELLERKCIPFNWDSGSIKEYMKENYGE